jgi:hypothetical protein
MSRGEVLTRSFTDVDNTPHDGHAAAAGSVVAMCTKPESVDGPVI